MSEFESCREAISKSNRSRSVQKRKLTMLIDKLKEYKVNNTLTKEIFDNQNVTIDEVLNAIKVCDEKILGLFEEYNVESVDSDWFEKELASQVSYHFNIGVDRAEFSEYTENHNTGNNSNPPVVENNFEQQGRSNHIKVSLPTLHCCKFSGTSKDTNSFNVFYNQFMNVIGLRDEFSNATKLAYLSSYLSDYALSIISHLSIINDNYPIAMELLKKEFLNKNLIIAKAYEFIIKNSVSNSYDIDFIKTKTYINEVRSMIFELKKL